MLQRAAGDQALPSGAQEAAAQHRAAPASAEESEEVDASGSSALASAQLPAAAAAAPRLLLRRCGECRACAHPQWKQRCERNAALAAAAGLPVRRRKPSGGAPGASPSTRPRPAGDASSPEGVTWPVQPRRPKNAFLLFAEGWHKRYRLAHPDASFAVLAETTGAAWRALPAEERAAHEAAAADALAAHAQAQAAFQARLAQLAALGHAPPAHLAPRGGGGGGAKKKRTAAAAAASSEDESSDSDDQGGTTATRWEECVPCARWVVVAEDEGGRAVCADCRQAVQLTQGAALESWVQCDTCGKWRSLSKGALRALAAAGEQAGWTCAQRRPGATCKSGADDWGAVRRKVAKEQGGPDAADAAAGGRLVLAERCAAPPDGQGEPVGGAGGGRTALSWSACATQPATQPHGPTGGMHGAPCGGVRPATRCEFVPGRDTLVHAATLACGLDARDARTGQLVLFTAAMPLQTLRIGEPFVTAAIAAYYQGRLPELRDGRESSGPVDVAAFLAEPKHGEAVEAALFRRKTRLAAAHAAAAAAAAAAGLPPPPPEPARTRYGELNYVVHVKHNQRAVYIGEEGDKTSNGNSIMSFNKSWKGNPIRSWSGGKKMADMPGAQPNKLVLSKLSTLLADVEPHLTQLAARVWDVFCAHPETQAVAARQLEYLLGGDGGRASAQLGSTGWNAYSFNLDYATAAHYDSKNVTGSYSALLILETGAPFQGSFYMLPQYRTALDVRQGVVLFHRSGDAEVGMHANSGLYRPEPASHRVALVFYLTTISDAAAQAMAAASPMAPQSAAGTPLAGPRLPAAQEEAEELAKQDLAPAFTRHSLEEDEEDA